MQPNPDQTIRLSLLANAGIFIKSRCGTSLVDALHREEGYPFSKVPADILHTMTAGQGPYANADYLCFTHTHPDHFTPGEAADYLQHNRCKALFLRQNPPRTDSAFEACGKRGIPFFQLSGKFGEVQHFPLSEEASLTAFAVHHLKEEYSAVVCSCLLLELCGKRILFLSDADHGRIEDFSRFEAPVDLALINPYCLSQPSGRILLKTVIRPKRLAVYHIPFAEDDRLGVRRLVSRLQERYQREFGPIAALFDASVDLQL